MKYFLLKIDSFLNTFSIVESGNKLSFKIESALDQKILSSINVDDLIIGCTTIDKTARMIFKVILKDGNNAISLIKELDVSAGGVIGDKTINELADKDIIEINEDIYNLIYSEMLRGLLNTEQSEDKYIVREAVDKDYSIEELGDILSKMCSNPDKLSRVVAIHMFGIKYGKIIEENDYPLADIIDAADTISSAGTDNYQLELAKGLGIYESIKDNEFGIKFYENDVVGSLPESKNCLDVKRNPRSNKIHPLNFIIYGAPGTGKTYSTAEYALAIIENRPVDKTKKENAERRAVMSLYKDYLNKGQVVFTTFHQSYGYEEFIQGLRPDTKSDKMSFKTIDGVFKRIADKALSDHTNNYVIIIDEINRANISKVFGELITLIEEDKRWGEINETCATLQSGDVFAVPNNLYIVGTMNSADKSISLIDAALRRRFEFIEQRPQPALISDAQLKKIFVTLNDSLVNELESADLLIGHSYFMNKTINDLESILNSSIIPLLYEYFYDNKKKVASILSKALEGSAVEIVDDKMGRLSVKREDA